MNFTKEQRGQMKDGYEPQTAWNKLIEDCDELEKELTASRDSRILSAVPSLEIEKLFNELEESYCAEYHGYEYKRANQIIRKFFTDRGIAG